MTGWSMSSMPLCGDMGSREPTVTGSCDYRAKQKEPCGLRNTSSQIEQRADIHDHYYLPGNLKTDAPHQTLRQLIAIYVHRVQRRCNIYVDDLESCQADAEISEFGPCQVLT